MARISQRAGAPVQGVDQAGKPHPGGHEVTGEVSRKWNGGPTRCTKIIERTLRVANFSWAPRDWSGAQASVDSPWLRMFRNARAWVG